MSIPTTSDTRFGQSLVSAKRCTFRQLSAALAKRRERNCVEETLADVVVELGVVDEHGVRESLAEIGELLLYCDPCTSTVRPPKYREKDADCARCGAPLSRVTPAKAAAAVEAAALRAKSTPRESAPVAEPVDDQQVTRPLPQFQDGAESGDESFLGRVLGGCEIRSRIAAGGMGVVYKAVQINLGRTVAVKVLSEELSRDKSFVDRFIEEARAAAHLSHGGIVHVIDVGEEAGTYFIVMEYVDGENLKDRLEKGGEVSIEETVQMVIQVCQALRHAHSRRTIHRDIKPENIMITVDGHTKVADLGLAKRVTEDSAGITHAGSILGTPYYMAPEQAKDFSKVDARSDIYSLGVTMYRALGGRVPFYGRSPIEVMMKVLDGKRPRLSELRPDIPEELEALVDRMMQRDPAQRFQSVDEVLDELMRIEVQLRSVVH